MIKAASSNARRGSGGIREMAEEAARRQRMSLGDWLNAVVADEAAASGVAVRDVSLEDRQTAIITRLRDLAPRAAAKVAPQTTEPQAVTPKDDPEARTETAVNPPAIHPAAVNPRAQDSAAPAPNRAAREEPKAERRDRDRRRDRTAETEQSRPWQRDSQGDGRKRGGSGGDGGRGRRDADPERSNRRRADPIDQRARAVDFEVSVEDMLAGIERRVARTQRQTGEALASMSQLIDTTEDQRSAFAAMAERLAEVEGQVVARGGEDMKPIKGALARVEARLDTLTRRGEPLQPAQVAEELAAGNRVAKTLLEGDPRRDEDAMAPATPEAIVRLEAKLNSILDAVQPGAAAHGPVPSARLAPRPLRDAIDEIANRQKVLDAAPHPLGRARVVRPMRDFDVNLPMSAEAAGHGIPGLAHIGRDVQTLLAKVEDVRRDVAGRANVQQADAQTRSLQDLRSDVAGLNHRMEQLRDSGDIHARLDPLSQSLDDLRRALAENDPRTVIGSLEREVRTVGSQLQGLGAVDAAAVSRLQTQTAEIRDLLSAATVEPITLHKIERDIATLMRRMDEPRAPDRAAAPAQTPEDLRALVEATIQTPVLQTIERRLDALTAKVDAAVSKTAAADPAALSRRMDAIHADLAARMSRETPAAGMADGETLERMVGTLTSAIEAARRPGAETDAFSGLEQQIGRLAERLDRSEDEFANLSTLQASVSALFGQLEETRKSSLDIAEQAARRAVRDRPEAETAGHVTREIADMRMLQDAADRRTSATLSAVHDTLEKMVERLAQMERGTPSTFADAAWSGAARLGTLDRADEARRPGAIGAGDVASSARGLDSAEDFLIEPGRGFPGRDGGADPSVQPEKGRADFIAAARRAARAAQRDAETVTAKRPNASSAGETAPHVALAQAKAFFASRKRAVVLSLAALFVIAGCYAVVRTAGHSESAPKAVSAVTAPKAPGRVMASETPPNAAIAASAAVPITGSDPVVAGSMAAAGPGSTSRVAATGVEMPRALPSTKLRDLADAGNAGAQFETGNRYAEGRGLPRDPKLAAQWYEKAATQGFAPAQYRLGSLFEKGAGVPRDLTTAKMWYGKAVAAGNARAMHNLAVLTAEGAGDKPDYPNAAILFRKAAELGIRDSQYNLAILLARGLGVSQNLGQSYLWFSVAAAQGDVDAGKKRDDVAARMSAADLAAAKTASDAFQPRPLDQAANDAVPPAGGWDGPVPMASDKATRPKVSTL